ncbi:hypothetical protein CFC21_051270 [Triticum aestivum]|uniref:Uncharacterized protein n=2 Tax=Triticum aestivum TaxID=4565 RepID=A0A3B6HSH4_WHEAT|nr:hypothetical protein CFC21_051270 [Triticum aestivum]
MENSDRARVHLCFMICFADFQNTECISCLAMLLIRQSNWIQTGLATRATPSKMNSIRRCLLNSEGKHSADTFALVEGMPFDSCQEALRGTMIILLRAKQNEGEDASPPCKAGWCISETGCEIKCARPQYFQAYGNVVQTFCWFQTIESSATVQILPRERSLGKTTEEEYDVAPTPGTTFTPVSTFGQNRDLEFMKNATEFKKVRAYSWYLEDESKPPKKWPEGSTICAGLMTLHALLTEGARCLCLDVVAAVCQARHQAHNCGIIGTKRFKVSAKARVIEQKVASLNQIAPVIDARRGHSESGVSPLGSMRC